MSILFAEGNPGTVQLLRRTDTGSIRDRVFEWMDEGEFAGKFCAVSRDIKFRLRISVVLDQGASLQCTNQTGMLCG